MAAAHVVVDDLATLELSGEDEHHLSSVLRLRDGEPVGVTDGRGRYVPCVWTSGRLSPTGPAVVSPPRVPALTVGFVPVKGDRPEWAVQKLTELGIDRIVLLSSERSVIRWEGSRLESHLERLRRVARSAVMQSRQVWMPRIEGVVPLAPALSAALPAALPAAPSAALPAAPSAALPAALSASPAGVAVADIGAGSLPTDVHTVLVGPEGGWSEAERDLFARSHTPAVSLGPSVLRAETAVVTAGVLMTALRAGLVGPPPT